MQSTGIRNDMVEFVKCSRCNQSYEKGKNHQCGERQKIAQEFSKSGVDRKHPDDDDNS